MAIVKTVTLNEFASTMHEDGFSREGAEALFEFLDDLGTDIEMDPIAFRCQYSEYTLEELLNAHPELEEEYISIYGDDLDDININEVIELFPACDLDYNIIAVLSDGIIVINQ